MFDIGLSSADLGMLLAYFAGITVLGLWASRHVTGLASFVMPRRFGKLMMLMHGFGTATHSDQAVSVAAKSFTNGLSGIWYQWMWLFATPFFWLIAPMMRRFRALTTADVFEVRYDRSVSHLFSLLGLLKFMVNIGTMLIGAGAVIEACTNGGLPKQHSIYLMTLLFLIYGVAGGLGAAIVTDFVQGILTIFFSFMLLPLVLNAVGGLSRLQEAIPRVTGRSDMFSLVAPGDIGVFYIAMIALNALIGVVVQPQNMGTCAAGRTEVEGAVGFMGGMFVKRVCTVAWCLTGLAAVAYYGLEVEKPDMVYGQIARDFLPTLAPGMLGLFIASLLATVMGSCDSFMIAASGLFTENIYKPVMPGRSEKHYLAVARVSALLVVVGGVQFAYWADNVIHGLETLWKVSAMMGMAFWLGLFWRRTTVAGAWAATLSAVAAWVLVEQSDFAAWAAQFQAARDWRYVVPTDKPDAPWAVYLPWQMVSYLTVSFVCGIVVSWCTQPVAEEKLEQFYSLLRTPITPGEEIETPCTLPAGTVVPPRRVFFPNSNLEIPIPSRWAIAGFVVGWILVGLIIASVALFVAE